MCYPFQKKLNIKLPYDPTIPFLSIYLKELKADTHIIYKNSYRSTIHIPERWKQLKCPSIDEWVNHGLHIQWNIIQS